MTVIDLTSAPAAHPKDPAAGHPPGPRPDLVLTTPGAPRSFRPDIEGMRALAVTLVVLYHAGIPFLPGGYVGVDVFFVISGYLITTHLTGELRSTGRISFTGFYARRAKRLLPLATIVTLATLVATYLLTSALQTRELAVDALWSGLFAMNIHLANDGVDYQAADGTASALQHFWSLAIEEQFYLAWPLILLIASLAWLRRRQRSSTSAGTNPASRVPAASTVVMNVVVLSAMLVSFAFCLHQTEVAQARAYFATPARAWELAAGGLIAINAAWLARQRRLCNDGVAIAGLALIIGSAVVLTNQSVFPGWLAVPPILGSVLVLVSGLAGPTHLETRILSQPLIQGLGRISYGLYLWHWPLLVLALAYLGTEKLTISQALGVIVVAVWISMATYFVFEDPLRLLPQFRKFPRRALGMGAGLMVLVVATSLAAANLIPDPTGSGVAAASLGDGSAISQSVEAGLALTRVPSNLTPSLATARRDDPSVTIPGAAACHANILVERISSDAGNDCVFGDPAGRRTVILAGDSHAFQWLPAIERLATERSWRLVSMTKAACPLYNVALVNLSLQRDYRECYSWRTAVLKRIAKEKPDLIITTGAIFDPKPGDFTQRWTTGVTETVTRLAQTGARVDVIADTPYPGTDMPKCLAANLTTANRCDITLADSLSDPARRTATDDAAAAAGATVINPLKWFCTSAGCPAVVGDTMVYRDNSHLTATYAATLAPLLGAALTRRSATTHHLPGVSS